MTTNINNSPEYACRTCAKQECGCKDTECQLPCHFYTEQAEQEPVALVFVNRHGDVEITDYTLWQLERGHYKIYAAPVRTKDLTVSELDAIIEKHYDDEMDLKAMILDGIAADRMKNK